MNRDNLRDAISYVSKVMSENRNYLVELDQKTGDGDLGISISNGYRAFADYLVQAKDETDIGKLLIRSAAIFNEAAPSSIGTITSIGIMGIGRKLKGKQDISLSELAEAMQVGLNSIMERTGSKPGEKTIIDAWAPAINALKENSQQDMKSAFKKAATAAADGAERTKCMISVHGRAAYYGEKSIGALDGGAVAGSLLFKALSDYIDSI